MKSADAEQLVRKNMRPGALTRDGFLGGDRRPLSAIIAADARTVQGLSLTSAIVAQRMAALRDAGVAGLGDWVHAAPHFDIRVESARGVLPCPFDDGHVSAKTTVTVRNLRRGRSISYTELNIHLIEAHGFYEGRGAAARLEPEELAAILEAAAPGNNCPRESADR
jgi:hypothetical protein